MASETQRFISVIGAAEHNLKNIAVEIPRDSLTVITGISGSGKSSLAFDTIYAEGQRRYVGSPSSCGCSSKRPSPTKGLQRNTVGSIACL